jgi:TLD
MMGMSESKHEFSVDGATSQVSVDLQELGRLVPFGDDELRSLYRMYHEIHQCRKEADKSGIPSSFLLDWGMACYAQSINAATEKQIRRRERLLSFMESNILPKSFGETWFSAVLAPSGDVAAYNDPSFCDEFTRKKRLESFFQGLSQSSRKGSASAVTCLFHCCSASSQLEDAATVAAMDFISSGYRVSLAIALLRTAEEVEGAEQQQSTQENEDNDMSWMASFVPAKGVLSDLSLQALSFSLSDRAQAGRGSKGNPADTNHVSLDEVLDWCDVVAPMFGSILPSFVHYLFFPNKPYPPSRTLFAYPTINQDSDIFVEATKETMNTSSDSSPLLFALACFSSALHGTFHRLYTSSQDGLSFNRLQNALLGYGGPTLMVLRSVPSASQTSGVFGAYSSSSWKESKDFYGNSDCFLFRISSGSRSSSSTCCNVYRPTGSARNFMYCNSAARSRGYDQQAHGIGFGGTTEMPRLFIEESFDDCVAGANDLTFDCGPLLPSDPSDADPAASISGKQYFVLDCIEVWGVGGDAVVQQALGARAQARDIKAEVLRRARKVDKAAFLDDFRSGLIDSKAFAHRQQLDGRENCHPSEQHE